MQCRWDGAAAVLKLPLFVSGAAIFKIANRQAFFVNPKDNKSCGFSAGNRRVKFLKRNIPNFAWSPIDRSSVSEIDRNLSFNVILKGIRKARSWISIVYATRVVLGSR